MEIGQKRVLVTGGAGFIGSHLVDKLVEIGSDVVVVDNFRGGRIENLGRFHNEIKFVRGDVRNRRLMKEVVKNVDVIFHFAANASVPNSVENPRYDFETNSLGTFNLLEASVASTIEKFVYASSAAVYGTPDHIPMDEKHHVNPVSPYGSSKLAGEKAGFAFRETYGLPFVAIRIFNVYGPRQPRYVVYDFYRKLQRDAKKLNVLGDGNQVRDFCFVQDAIDAILLVSKEGQGVYNLAGGEPISIRELAEFMVSEISPKASVAYGGENWKGDISTLVADVTKLRNLGFTPRTSLREGIRKTIDWFNQYRIENHNHRKTKWA